MICKRHSMPGLGRLSPWEQRGMGQQVAGRIDALAQLLGGPSGAFDLIQESEQPASELLANEVVADRLVTRISDPHSGKGSDELCQWLYEAYQSGDSDFQTVVLSCIPTLCGVYFSRTCGDEGEPLAGFEAVLLALYTGEARARGGRPALIQLPSLSSPSLYHTPPPVNRASAASMGDRFGEQLSAPLEPQTAIKSTKRAAIVGLALDLFCRCIALMPLKSKVEFCQHAERWAVLGCSWRARVDEIAKASFVPVEPVAPPRTSGEKIPELGHAFATGESLAVSQAVFEQPPHQRLVESGKAALMDRTSSDLLASSAGSQSFNSATSSVEQLGNEAGETSAKLPLTLDLLRPIFKGVGHCLMARASTREVREAGANAAKALYVRATEDLAPEAILASRSLVRLSRTVLTDTRVSDGSGSFRSMSSSQRNSPNIVLQQS